MKTANILPLAALALCAGLTAQDAGRHAGRHEGRAPGHQTADLRAEAAKLFAQGCASCHLPPDPSFAVDRAWITQLADTA